ncbi:MAG: LacI family DNA-binding transcriptional regulator [Pseudobutyrivibrio sp.]|uniref:LacI family DNA-binding transcriptional regulator n=1 Tax=Pseudobutyrivibrio sp. TaxID=2014367 RepID=UPI0025D18ED2|nr:LacI family DNA-binding transcriptional regulator [Pseudobutyrivibrio sp.]MBQ6462667.1 LacI family DNA-binding transcriptional regulator [Pseudobutyrivibrio sp.]
MNLKDIAKLAGVSTATVSNVLNGNTSKVSETTKERIEKIIKEVDYKPNAMARSLAKKESKMIGLVVPYIGPDEDFFMNPYYARMVAALERYVRSKEYYLMLRCVPDCRQVIPQLSSWNVDGVFFLGVVEPDVKEIISALDAPVVFLDTYTKEKNIVNVGLDDYKGGYLSARYLIGKGHKRIALACPDYKGTGVVRERYLGFKKACEEAKIEFTEDDIYRTDTVYKGAISVGNDIALSGKGYTAVATMSDIVAFGLMEGIKQCGLRVPDDISVIGFDNLAEGEYVYPKLTTISQDINEKANAAGRGMFEILEGNKDYTADIHLPVQIIERQTVRQL